MHEDHTRRHDVIAGSERAFAFVFAAVMVLFALAPLRRGLPIRTWLLVAAAVLVLTGLLRPGVLKPLNHAWLRFGLALNRITSPLILGIVFFAGVVPTGLLMRWRGRTPLQLKRQPDRRTYWVDRAGGPPSSMSRQF